MLDFSQEGVEGFRVRFLFAHLFVGLFLLLVMGRLFVLQIVRGHQLQIFSADHTIKEIRLPAPRGVIYDRNHVILVQSRPSLNLVMIRQHVKDFGRLKTSLKQMIGLSPDFVESKWNEAKKQPAFYPIELVPDLPIEQVAKIRVAQALPEDEDLDLRGVDVVPHPLRDYPTVTASFLGYLTQVSQGELEEHEGEMVGRFNRYNPGDLIGAAGLERYWEDHLKGMDGYHQRVVDAVGREITTPEMQKYVSDQPPRPGDNLILSIDSRLQQTAERGFQKSGALVALNVRDGGVLAMVSYPSYDPKTLQGLTAKAWQDLVNDPGKLFLNRAVQGTYPPGSTYKITTAIAALEEKVVGLDERVSCPGGVQFGGRLFRCWKAGGHGALSLIDAIAQSCDSYFYTMGIRLGVDRLAKYANILGLGKPTGVDLLGERAGLIPTAAWKEKSFKAPWQPGENLSIAIGQGYDTVTPIENAVMIARVASGKSLQPHLVERIESVDGTVLMDYQQKVPEDLPVSAATLKSVREGLHQVVASPSGTAHRFFTTEFTMAGKTGTAQAVGAEAKARGVRDEGDHALFVAYAPVEDPEIAVAVVVEHGGHGGVAAAPIAKDVITQYFELKKQEASHEAPALRP